MKGGVKMEKVMIPEIMRKNHLKIEQLLNKFKTDYEKILD